MHAHGIVSRWPIDGISSRPPFTKPSPKKVLFITAANSYNWNAGYTDAGYGYY